jgi:hypothetical protein
MLIERSSQSQPVFPANLLPRELLACHPRVTTWPDLPPWGGIGR